MQRTSSLPSISRASSSTSLGTTRSGSALKSACKGGVKFNAWVSVRVVEYDGREGYPRETPGVVVVTTEPVDAFQRAIRRTLLHDLLAGAGGAAQPGAGAARTLLPPGPGPASSSSSSSSSNPAGGGASPKGRPPSPGGADADGRVSVEIVPLDGAERPRLRPRRAASSSSSGEAAAASDPSRDRWVRGGVRRRSRRRGGRCAAAPPPCPTSSCVTRPWARLRWRRARPAAAPEAPRLAGAFAGLRAGEPRRGRRRRAGEGAGGRDRGAAQGRRAARPPDLLEPPPAPPPLPRRPAARDAPAPHLARPRRPRGPPALPPARPPASGHSSPASERPPARPAGRAPVWLLSPVAREEAAGAGRGAVCGTLIASVGRIARERAALADASPPPLPPASGPTLKVRRSASVSIF
eukprot:tig00000670_g3046.t1